MDDQSLRILFVEDVPTDVELAQRALRKEGIAFESICVETRADFTAALETFRPDLIISDYHLPTFDGMQAVNLAHTANPNLPVIIFTGALNEETAVACIKAGAIDYVLKDRIARLPFAVREAIAQRAAERARAESETRYRQLFNSISDMVFVHTLTEDDQPGAIIEVNDVACQKLGYTRQELIGMIIRDMNVPDSAMDAPSTVRKLKAGEPITFEGLTRAKDGSQIQAEVHVQSFVLEGQTVALSVVRDITERKRAETKLAQSEKRFRAMIENSADAIALIGRDGSIIYEGSNLERLTGYTGEERVGKNGLALVYPDDLPIVRAVLGRVFAKPGAIENAVFRSVRKDGTIWWTEATATNLLHEPSVQAIVINYRDITARKQADQVLQESERRFQLAMQATRDGLWDWDVTSGAVYYSPGYFAMLGYAANELPEHVQTWVDLIHPDDRAHALAANTDCIENRVDHFEAEFRMRTRAGDWKWILGRGKAITRDEQGRALRMIGTHTDVTERKHAEDVLRVSEELNRTLVQNAPIGISVRDRNGKLIAYNAAWQKIWAIPDHAIHADMDRERESLQLDERDNYLNRFQADVRRVYEQGGSLQLHELKTAGRRPGSAEWVAQYFYAIQNAQGEVDRVVVLTQDISERKQREREMEAVAGISAALRVARTRAEMFPIIAEQVATLAHASSIALAFREHTTDDLVLEYTRGQWSDALYRRTPAGTGISQVVIASGKPYVTNDLPNDPLFYHRDLIGDLRALATIPLNTPNETIGFIGAGRIEPFSDQDTRVLTALADIAANALQRATLHEQTEQQLRQVQALHEIDTAIAASVDLRIAFNILLGRVISDLHADAARVLLFDPRTRTFHSAESRGVRGGTRTPIQVSEWIAGRVVAERRTLHLDDLARATPIAAAQRFVSEEGLYDYYGAPLIAKGQVKGVLEVFHRAAFTAPASWLEFLEILAQQAAIAIDNLTLFNELQTSNLQLTLAYDATIEGWSRALDLRDHETEGHTQRVTEMTLALARAWGVNENDLAHIRRGALLHDIGKLAISDTILLKPDKLTAEEWVLMRAHPTIAHHLLSPIEYLRPALDIPYCHHERWDGSGYPRGLAREQIPIAARIFAVADVWDALVNHRPYRPAWSHDQAREYIRDQAGKHFDPQVVALFFEMRP